MYTDKEYTKFLINHAKGESKYKDYLTLAIQLIKENIKKVDSSSQEIFWRELFDFISEHTDDDELSEVFGNKLLEISKPNLIRLIETFDLLLAIK